MSRKARHSQFFSAPETSFPLENRPAQRRLRCVRPVLRINRDAICWCSSLCPETLRSSPERFLLYGRFDAHVFSLAGKLPSVQYRHNVRSDVNDLRVSSLRIPLFRSLFQWARDTSKCTRAVHCPMPSANISAPEALILLKCRSRQSSATSKCFRKHPYPFILQHVSSQTKTLDRAARW